MDYCLWCNSLDNWCELYKDFCDYIDQDECPWYEPDEEDM